MEEDIELKIIDTSMDGAGVAKLDGLTIFVPYAIEGETVIVHHIEKHKNYATARLKKILDVSSRRRYAPCKYYGICGGCQLMHLNYQTQSLFKQLSLAQTLKRAGITMPVSATKESDEFEFRNSVQLKVSYEPEFKLGFYVPKSHELIDIEECIVCGSWFKFARSIIADFLKETAKENIVHNIYITCFQQNDELSLQVNFQTSSGVLAKSDILLNKLNVEFRHISIYSSKQEKDNTLLNYKTCRFVCGERNIKFEFLGQRLRLQPTDFFQINTVQAESLFTNLKKQIEVIQPNILVDLFCGIGAFSTAISSCCNYVYGIDINKSAIENAKSRAKEQNIQNVHFFAGDCNKLIYEIEKEIIDKNSKKGEFIEDFESLILNSDNNTAVFSKLLYSSHSNKNVLFLDPSRIGAGKNVLDFVNKMDFSDVFYLSCNPHSLVKDLKILSQNYEIESIVPYDMFPQTNKIETLVHLVKGNENDFDLKVEAKRLQLVTR